MCRCQRRQRVCRGERRSVSFEGETKWNVILRVVRIPLVRHDVFRRSVRLQHRFRIVIVISELCRIGPEVILMRRNLRSVEVVVVVLVVDVVFVVVGVLRGVERVRILLDEGNFFLRRKRRSILNDKLSFFFSFPFPA